MRLMCVDPENGEINVFKGGSFISIPRSSLPTAFYRPSFKACYEGRKENSALAIVGQGDQKYGN
jgi:hypothetical protein